MAAEIISFLLGGMIVWLVQYIMKNKEPQTPTFQRPSKPKPIPTQPVFQKSVTVKTTTSQNYVVNGVVYKTLDEVPEPFRQQIRDALKEGDENLVLDNLDNLENP